MSTAETSPDEDAAPAAAPEVDAADAGAPEAPEVAAAPEPAAPAPRPPPAASVDDRILFHEELSWKQLDDLDRERTVFFLILAPLDQHGPHLPVGMDCFAAQAYAAAAARRLCREHAEFTAVLCPILPVGAQTFDYLGSVDIRRRIIRDLVTDFGASLASYEFLDIVVVTSHGAPGHLMAIDEACAWVNDRFGARMHSPMPRVLQRLTSNSYRDHLKKALGTNGSTVDLSQDHHAGHLETSLMLYLRPELVDLGYSRLKAVKIEADRLNEAAARTLGDKLGYFGNPAAATKELGREIVALAGKEIVDTLMQVRKDPDLLLLQRPPLLDGGVVYRTDFMRWVLTGLVALLVLATWALFG